MESGKTPLKEKIHEIIFEADTPMGKFFDVVLLVMIVLSVLVVMLETVEAVDRQYHKVFMILEWVLTILFTIEYGLRLYSVHKPMKYALSFYGVIDLLAIIPTYLSLVVTGSQYFLVIRALRLMRAFRVFKLARFVVESNALSRALVASKTKLIVFLTAICIVVVIIGSAMYIIETGENSGFSSIPMSIYWAVVTLTTVGYGDIAPVTVLGQFLSAVLMIIGYAIIAVPSGIVTAEIMQGAAEEEITTQACSNCSREGHDTDAKHCKYCGHDL